MARLGRDTKRILASSFPVKAYGDRPLVTGSWLLAGRKFSSLCLLARW